MLYKTNNSASALQFSPFIPGRIAVSTSQNFGIVGNGQISVLQASPGGLELVCSFDTLDAALDVAWSEDNENVLAASCGDGSIKLWDTQQPPQLNPIRSLQEHVKEVASVDWNSMNSDTFISASWDDTVKIWSTSHPHSIRTFARHTYCVYCAKWNPQHADVFLSASGDRTAMIWDARQAAPSLVLQAHRQEILCADWCKYNDCVLATASTDRSIKIWDVRSPNVPVTQLNGHSYPVRKVAFSPRVPTELVSASYDMTVRLWDYAAPEDALINMWQHHTEFVCGLDWDILNEGVLGSCSWDCMVATWPKNGDPRA